MINNMKSMKVIIGTLAGGTTIDEWFRLMERLVALQQSTRPMTVFSKG
jgi:hypothetical protein